eukprot:CAMPEP_0206306912 /NCGR_PEP_ID=MMETSP0106_2-20121207/11053_1 /ASSEMBLY_ACC=CAM_ASM_000206 /TAXON_ID=81532 /ORGANISM="Acanthoeca-like sp., Strain 10tr" /LENGTH=40 /DNA_ID= /DNA_START= /DNA_END= /DNA_ORIENTATION=
MAQMKAQMKAQMLLDYLLVPTSDQRSQLSCRGQSSRLTRT